MTEDEAAKLLLTDKTCQDCKSYNWMRGTEGTIHLCEDWKIYDLMICDQFKPRA